MQLRLFVSLIVLALMTASSRSEAQPYGLDAITPMGPFLDGTLPTRTPQSPENVRWMTVDAFPNVPLPNTLVIASNPADNRLYVGSRQGEIVSIPNDPAAVVADKKAFMDLGDRVADVWDGGFLGLVFHPEFGQSGSPYELTFYAYYSSQCDLRPGFDAVDLGSCNNNFPTEPTNGFYNVYLRLSRFTARWDAAAGVYRGIPSSETPMIHIRLYNSTHRGGGLAFGNDGYLYLTFGEHWRYMTAQDIVKAVSNDAPFKSKNRIGAVNSINWARVAAQVVYYFKGYFAATQSNDEQVAFCVPSGNFGNICAGHIARQMGLPIGRLVLATNENNVLDEFFRTGVYRPRATAETHITSSPSMDISKASNFERFVFDLVGRDPKVVAELWGKVDAGGAFDLNDTPYIKRMPDFAFVSGSSSHADRLATIRKVWEEYGVMIDTHTADGVKVALENMSDDMPMVVLETAQPVKFAETIREALGRDPIRPDGFEGMEDLPQHVEVMEPDVAAVKEFIVRHSA